MREVALAHDYTNAPRRYDTVGLLRAYRREDGAILADGIASREGILLYPQADGSVRRELVTREAVLDTARTLPRSTLTNEHPPVFINADNVGEFGAGDVDGTAEVVEEEQQGAFVRIKVAIRRRDALDAWDAGKRDVSVGYEVSTDDTPGEHPVFGRYDARQIGRRCNHLALTSRGRAGSTVALRADSADAAGYYDSPTTGDRYMKPALVQLLALLGVSRMDAEDVAIADGLAAAKKLNTDAQKYSDEYVGELEQAKKDAEAAAEKAQAKLDKMAKDMEEMQGKLDAMAAKAAEAEKAEQDRKDAAELVRLQGLAGKVNVKHDGLTIPALRLAIAKTRVDSVDDKTSPERLDGILSVVEADAAKGKGSARSDAYRFDKAADDKGAETDPRADHFFNPFLRAIDDARKETA